MMTKRKRVSCQKIRLKRINKQSIHSTQSIFFLEKITMSCHHSLWLVCPLLEGRTSDNVHVPTNTSWGVECVGAWTYVDPSKGIRPLCDLTHDGFLRQGFSADISQGLQFLAFMVFKANHDAHRSRHSWLPCKMNVVIARAEGKPNEDDMRIATEICKQIKEYTPGDNPHRNVEVKWEFRRLTRVDMVVRMGATCNPVHEFTRTFGLKELNRLAQKIIACNYLCVGCKKATCRVGHIMCPMCCGAFVDVDFGMLKDVLRSIVQ